MKRILLKALALIAALVFSAQLHAAPPANDNLAAAQALAGDIGALIADTSEATLEEAEEGYYCYDSGTNTVWYKWTSTSKEKIPFFLSASRMSGSGRSCISVYTNSNESAGVSYDNLIEVVGGSGWLNFCAEPGRTYLICLSSYSQACNYSPCSPMCCENTTSSGKFALRWWRELAKGEWKILAADGIVFDALGDLPEDLKATDFPAGVTEIAEYAFEDVEGVKFVTIPASVKKIGDYAFGWASDLSWVDYDGDTNAIDVADTAFFGTPYSSELPFKLILEKGTYTNVVGGACTIATAATTNIEEYCAVEGFVGTCPEELVIPEGVTEVGVDAFSDAVTLVKVTFPSTLEYIEEYAFYGCSALEEVAGIPDAAEVDDLAFAGSLYETTRPFELITYEDEWSDGTTNVWVVGFHGTCPEELTIPEGIYGVEYGAFSLDEDERYDDDDISPRYLSLANLKKVTFASSVKEIYDYAFSYLPNLEDVVFLGTDTYTYVEEYAFIATPYYSKSFGLDAYVEVNDGYRQNLYDEDGNWTNEVWVAYDKPEVYLEVYGYRGTCPAKLDLMQNLHLPADGIYDVYIDESAFSGAATLEEIVIPPGSGYIEDYAFANCENLAKVTFLGNQDDIEIGAQAFVGCASLPFIKLIADYWVDDGYWQGLYDEDGNWTNEVWVAYDQPTRYLEVYGHVGTCPAKLDLTKYLTTNTIDVLYVDGYAFADEATLEEIVIPAGSGYIDDYAFANCENLAKVTFLGNEGDMYMGDWAFIGCTSLPFRLIADEWDREGYWQGLYDEDGNWTNSVWVAYDQPTRCLEIYGYIGTCPAKLDLTKYLTTNTVDVVYVDEHAFEGAATLEEVVFPAGGGDVEDYAFANCENLAKVTFLGNEGDMYMGDWAFIGCTSLPFRLIADEWDREGYWQGLYDEDGNWTNSVWVAYDQPTRCLEIYGYIGTCPAKLDLTKYLTTNTVDEVYFVGDDCEFGVFQGETALTELVLPKAEYDSCNAFRDCTNLVTVTIGGDYATNKLWLSENFRGTPWLDTAVPFELVTEVNVCTNIQIETVYKDDVNCCTLDGERYSFVTNTVVTTTKTVVGYYGNDPETLTFPEDIDEIDSYVFADCDNITEIVVPGNVKTVGYGAFQYCDNLQNVEFQEGVEYIGSSLFYGCGDGMQVILPASAVVGYYDADTDEWNDNYCFSYTSVFNGINGDVDVVAPRTTLIYDRAFYGDPEDDEYLVGYFGRTCVEYYTYVALDANGGTFDGDAKYRCFDDIVTGLPMPVLSGNVFREWRDEDGNMYRNGDVWGANTAQVYLKAEWAAEQKYTVYGLDGPAEVALGEGDDYETLLRVLEDAYGAEPLPSRHGLNFSYWTVDGEELNHRSVIGPNSEFGVYFDEFNPLTDNSEAAVAADAAQTYDGYILDEKGEDAGTIQVKVGKPNKNTGEAKVSASVQMFGMAKMQFKADPKGSWKLSVGGATKGVTLSSPKATDRVVIDISEKGIFGTFGSYDIVGARNTSKNDAAYAKWVGKKYEVAFKTKEGTGSPFAGGYSAVTVSIAAKGKVKITGVMADGAKVNANAQLLISDKGEGCVNAFVPMYPGKKGGFGFVLWIDPDYTTTYVESVSTWTSLEKTAPFTAELEPVDAAAPAPAGAMTFALESVPAISGANVLTNYLPVAVKASFAGGKLSVAKANKIKADNKSGTVTSSGETDNDAGLKLNYTAKTGAFKGSFTVYTIVNSKLKKVKADVNGVFVGGVGYGTAVIKKVGSYPVTLR